MGERNSSILLVHDDPEFLDRMTGLLEARGHAVSIGATAFAAIAKVEDQPMGAEFEAVIAAWDAAARSGAKLYKWVLENRYHLRDRFVFLAADRPADFGSTVDGDCALCAPGATEEILSAVDSLLERVRALAGERVAVEELSWGEQDTKAGVSPDLLADWGEAEEASAEWAEEMASPLEWTETDKSPGSSAVEDVVASAPEPTAAEAPIAELTAADVAAAEAAAAQIASSDVGDMTIPEASSDWSHDAPRLLLVEDEPLQMKFMVKLFSGLGFSVTTADSGNNAIALLDEFDYDVVLADWYMPNGSGAELYDWISDCKPQLLSRCFFMSGGVAVNGVPSAPPGCRIFPKGQDSHALVQTLLDAASLARRNSA